MLLSPVNVVVFDKSCVSQEMFTLACLCLAGLQTHKLINQILSG